ncbi:MAG: hypothetical protein B7Z08_09525 [Sphingomonadales bacterium 32-68-7]|nr:MAG: hypothetical protein B7Z08_09525 [Sphingomonadales bacterium 32-68-7]
MIQLSPVERPFAVLAAAALCACAPPFAQMGHAQAVVQPLPPPESARLNEALRTLSRDPRSLSALLAAGHASLALDDPEAAFGFFQRAQAVAPQDGQVKAGLAGVLVRRQQPAEALRLYAEAEQAGAAATAFAAERGLAYDLIGDNARAQAEYRRALEQSDDPAVTRRLALSLAISGDQRTSEATLLPLLQRTDLASYRTRAFALAILGQTDEAVSIAETMLPERISGRLAPYLRYMPRLTRAQQAAAANLGAFPSAGDIGRDMPAIAANGTAPGAPAPVRTADARLAPSGAPLGTADRAAAQQSRPAPPVVAGDARRAAAPPVALAPPAAAPAAPPPPAAAAPPAAPPAARLADAFAEFRMPAAAPRIVAPAAGAVDITAIEPRREQPAPAARPAPPKPPPVPSRHWVQIATGRDLGAWRSTGGGSNARPAGCSTVPRPVPRAGGRPTAWSSGRFRAPGRRTS